MNAEDNNNGDDRFPRLSPLLFRILFRLHYFRVQTLPPNSKHKPYCNTENNNKYCRYQQCGQKYAPNIRASFFSALVCIIPVRRCLCLIFVFWMPELRHYHVRSFKTAHIRNGASVVIIIFLFHSRLFVIQMADDTMTGLHLALHGSFGLAFFHTVSTACMEFASLRRICRRRN